MTVHEKLDILMNAGLSSTKNKPIFLGNGTNFSVNSYEGYENFTVENNFIICMPSSVSTWSEKYNNGSLVVPAPGNTVSPTATYDNQTGILTISGLSASSGTHNVVVGGSVYGGINVSTRVADPKVYLILSGLN